MKNQIKTHWATHSRKYIIAGLVAILMTGFIGGLAFRPTLDVMKQNVRDMFRPKMVNVVYEGSEVEKAKKLIAKEPVVIEAVNDMITSIYERREADKKLHEAVGHDARAKLSSDRVAYKYADLMGEEVATSTKGK